MKESQLPRFARVTLLGGVIVLLGVLLVWRKELPQWEIGGTRTVDVPSVSVPDQRPSCPVTGSTIAILGDSHVAGSRLGPNATPSRNAYPAVLETELQGRVKVVAHGAGGATAIDGENRWKATAMAGDLVVLAFGTNDAAARGMLASRQPTPLAQFNASLARQALFWRQQGREVMLMAPPPPGSRAMAERIVPYREAVAALGTQLGIAILDPADAFARCDAMQPLLTADALHMNVAGHHCLGQWLATQLCPTD